MSLRPSPLVLLSLAITLSLLAGCDRGTIAPADAGIDAASDDAGAEDASAAPDGGTDASRDAATLAVDAWAEDAARSTADAGTDASSACSYDAPNDCQTALELAPVDGDQNADSRRTSGATSRWFRILVTDSAAMSGDPLSFTATLAPAPGADFALFAYDGSVAGPDCSATPTVGSGTPMIVHEQWDDVFGVDDSRWITLEVRYVGGTGCGTDATWTLTVDAHT